MADAKTAALSTPQTTGNPRRFQYSLRTLMAAVLLYGLSWTLTATWGVWDVGEQLTGLFNDHRFYHTVIHERRDRIFCGERHGSVKGSGFSPFPFVVRWHFEIEHVDGNGSWDATHLWFFGFKYWLDQQK